MFTGMVTGWKTGRSRLVRAPPTVAASAYVEWRDARPHSEREMIVRHVFLKLKPEFGGEAALAEVVARSRRLAAIEGVRGLWVGMPADAGATAAWDLSLSLQFDALEDVERYLDDPGHEAYYEGFLEPRIRVIKAWNFEV